MWGTPVHGFVCLSTLRLKQRAQADRALFVHCKLVCNAPACELTPSFNFEGMAPVTCSKHKAPGMINVVAYKCQHPGCPTAASQAYPGSKPPLYCRVHALEGMENVRTQKCEQPGCKSCANYGVPGSTRRFCKAHKADGMVNVVSTRCSAQGCSNFAVHGFPGGKRRFCSTHKLDGMVSSPSSPSKRKAAP
ncbi:hypothetical protein WJX81_000339 [Elliptochloris bilobata]|uniref:EsV-1-7 n=1 Tax=Elliptochloris bilobata TaxID=381761 RepID=A0AAW1QVF8_9CHLO